MTNLELFLVVCGIFCTYIAPVAVIVAAGEKLIDKALKSKVK